MSSNPYSAPESLDIEADDPRRQVQGPAISLIVVSGISIACTVLSLTFSAYLLLSGAAARMPPSSTGISKEAQIEVRMAWGALILVSSIVILMGAIRMRALRNLGLARVSATLAIVPCLGPCCLLGIPFGIWALVVLNRPGVPEAFE